MRLCTVQRLLHCLIVTSHMVSQHCGEWTSEPLLHGGDRAPRRHLSTRKCCIHDLMDRGSCNSLCAPCLAQSLNKINSHILNHFDFLTTASSIAFNWQYLECVQCLTCSRLTDRQARAAYWDRQIKCLPDGTAAPWSQYFQTSETDLFNFVWP